MKLNYTKIAKLIIPIAIVSIILGYFLWTILILIQDFHTMTRIEVLEAQQEFALNYPLGRFLMYAGFIGLISSTVYLIVNKIRTRKNRKVLLKLEKRITLRELREINEENYEDCLNFKANVPNKIFMDPVAW